MDFLEQLLEWATAHLDELKLIGIVAALIAIIAGIYNGWNWVRGRSTGGLVKKGVKTTEQIAELASDNNQRLERIEKILQARLASQMHSLPGTAGSGGPDSIAKDLSAAIATIAAEGKIAALDKMQSGDLGAADAVLADKIAQIETMRTGAARQEAMLYRQRGALAFLHDTERALRAYAKAAELDPDDPEGWLQLGQLQMRGGYLPAAKASFERLLALRNSISDPQLVHWAHILLGDVEAALGNRAPALVQYDQALALIKALAQRDPSNAGWQRDLSVSYNKIADIRAARGDRDGALASYEDGLSIRKALAQRDPSNAEWQRDLSVSYNKIADIRAARGDRDGALASYEDGLSIAKALAQRDPSNAEWQTDLVVSAWKLAAIGAPNACGHLRNGLAILKRLDAENRLTAAQKEWMPALEGAIAERRR